MEQQPRYAVISGRSSFVFLFYNLETAKGSTEPGDILLERLGGTNVFSKILIDAAGQENS